jgi:hypothetical protein
VGQQCTQARILYVDDLAGALVFLATLDDPHYDALVKPSRCPLINVVGRKTLPTLGLHYQASMFESSFGDCYSEGATNLRRDSLRLSRSW